MPIRLYIAQVPCPFGDAKPHGWAEKRFETTYRKSQRLVEDSKQTMDSYPTISSK